jgi:hypothetical protein
MVIKRVIYTIPFLSVFNSAYLSYTYLESFMLGKSTSALVSNFALLLMTPFFTISVVFIMNILKNKSSGDNLKTIRSIFLDNFIAKIILVNLAIILLAFIYDFLKSDYNRLLMISVSIFIEIISVSFAVGKRREKAILKLLGFIAFWAYLTILCLCTTGFFSEYLGYKYFDNPNVMLIFTGIFYHLLNACFLFYSFSLKNMAQWNFKKINLSRRENVEIPDL